MQLVYLFYASHQLVAVFFTVEHRQGKEGATQGVSHVLFVQR